MLQCGETWRCKLDGAGTACHPFPTDYLHATSEPPPDAPTFTPFTPKVLVMDLAAVEVPAYLERLQFDADSPIDLRRKKPDSEAWFDVLVGRQDIADLPDDDLRQLQYVVAGGLPACSWQCVAGAPGSASLAPRRRHQPACRACQPCHSPHLTSTVPHAGGTAKPTTKSGAPQAPEEREALVAALQRAAAGSWKMVFVCAHATTCCCPYAIEFKHNGGGTVTVTQAEAHQFHDPSSAEDKARLKMHPFLHTIGTMLLRLGVKPMQVCNELNAEALREGLLGSQGSALQQASNARASITLAQVKAVAKQLKRALGYGLTGDASAIAAQLEEYKRHGCVPFFQPYRAKSEEGGEQPLIIILQTPFQQRMLGQFGCHLVFMDATYGTNKYGYPLYALTVSAGEQAVARLRSCRPQAPPRHPACSCMPPGACHLQLQSPCCTPAPPAPRRRRPWPPLTTSPCRAWVRAAPGDAVHALLWAPALRSLRRRRRRRSPALPTAPLLAWHAPAHLQTT